MTVSEVSGEIIAPEIPAEEAVERPDRVWRPSLPGNDSREYLVRQVLRLLPWECGKGEKVALEIVSRVFHPPLLLFSTPFISIASVLKKGGERLALEAGIEEKMGEKEKIGMCLKKIGELSSSFDYWLKGCWDRQFLYFHPGEYGQYENVALEIASRVIHLVYLPYLRFLTFSYKVVGSALNKVGNKLNDSLFREVRGTFSGEVRKKPRTMIINPHMSEGYISGLTWPEDRLPRLVRTLRDNDPDMVFLSEVNRSIGGTLVKELKDRYHFFFSEFSLKGQVEKSPFFIAFRGDLLKPPEYVSFPGQSSEVEKGACILETSNRVYLCVDHPRLEDVQELCSKDFGDREVYLMGDLGFDKNHPTFSYLKEAGFVSKTPEGVETGTNAPSLSYEGKEGEPTLTKTCFLFVKGEDGKEGAVLSMYDLKIPREALSNQNGILI